MRRLILGALACSIFVSCINLGLAIYHVAVLEDLRLMALALVRVAVHMTGVFLMLYALAQLQAAMRLYRDESAFLKQWILDREARRRD